MRPSSHPWLVETSRGWLPAALGWLLLVMMTVPDNFDYVTKFGDVPTEGSAMSRILWLTLIFGGAACVLSRAGMAWLLVRSINPFLLLFAVLAAMSVIWSIAPEVTARRCIRIAAMILVAMAIMLPGWRPGRFQEIVRPAITALLLGSIIFGVMYPQLAIHQEKSPELLGAWHGLANHKNSFGAMSCIGVVLWANAFFAREVNRVHALIGTAIAVTALVLSRSTTSVVNTVFCVTLLLMMQKMPRGLRRYLPWFVSLFVLALVLYSLVSLRLLPGADLLLRPIAHMAGKDTSFTGRTDIWAVMTEHISYHPIFGTGYGAYWVGPLLNSESYLMVQRLMFYPASAHNGYLDVTNDLGFVGLACLIGFLIVYVRQTVQLSKFNHGQAALFLALFLQQAVTNLSESHWFSVLSIGFVISTMCTVALARGILDHRLREYFAAVERSKNVRGEWAASRPVSSHAGAQRVGA